MAVVLDDRGDGVGRDLEHQQRPTLVVQHPHGDTRRWLQQRRQQPTRKRLLLLIRGAVLLDAVSLAILGDADHHEAWPPGISEVIGHGAHRLQHIVALLGRLLPLDAVRLGLEQGLKVVRGHHESNVTNRRNRCITGIVRQPGTDFAKLERVRWARRCPVGDDGAGKGASNALGELGYTFTTAPATLAIGGGPPQPIPVANGTFTTSDGRTLSLSVTGVPAGPLTGTFTARAGLSTDGGRTVVEVGDYTVTNVDTGQVLNVDPRSLGRTGTEAVKFSGTFDAFTTLITLRDLLQNAGGATPEQVRDQIAQMLQEVDGAHDAVLDGLREIGFRSSSMEVLQNRVEGLRISRTESLSLIEDVDLSESLLEMQRQDLTYQASLQVSARIVQTSLLNYL
jgi:hypothetical protein